MSRCVVCRTDFAEPRTAAPDGWYHHVGEFYGWRWEFDQALTALRSRPDTRRVLEIGCGEGRLLERLSGDYEVSGLDSNADAVLAARGKGLRVDVATLPDVHDPPTEPPFDAILFFHVIEHVEDPLRFLLGVRAALAPGGLILFSVPNERRLSLLVQRESWDYPPHHLTRFSRAGLGTLLERAGFRVSAMRDEPAGVSAYRWAATYANEVIRRTGFGEPMSWPALFRWAVKLLIVPVVCWKAFRRPERRRLQSGLSLFVAGAPTDQRAARRTVTGTDISKQAPASSKT